MKKAFAIIAALLSAMSCANKQEPKEWKPVPVDEFQTKPIDLLANQWMALTVGNREYANSMTIAWGSFGQLWSKPIVIVYVSEDRFTKHLMDENEYFTVTAFPEDARYREALSYLGSESGRNTDKMKGCGLAVEYTDLGNPIFAEGNLAIECRKIYSDAFNLDLVPAEVRNGMYSELGVHSFYIGEIVNIWEK